MTKLRFEDTPMKFEEFEKRLQVLSERTSKITKSCNVQNEKFDKLWDGFITLKYVEPEIESEIRPIGQKEFVSILQPEIIKMDELLKSVFEDRCKLDVERCERQIIKIYKLTDWRWLTIIEEQKLRSIEWKGIWNRKQKVFLRMNEIVLMSESEHSLKEVESFFESVLTLVEEEEVWLGKSENHLDEMEHLLMIRDRLFGYSNDLFLE